jgi:hypothetical protein
MLGAELQSSLRRTHPLAILETLANNQRNQLTLLSSMRTRLKSTPAATFSKIKSFRFNIVF